MVHWIARPPATNIPLYYTYNNINSPIKQSHIIILYVHLTTLLLSVKNLKKLFSRNYEIIQFCRIIQS